MQTTMGVGALFDEAEQALARGAGGTALSALLRAWQACRAEEVAELIEQLSPRVPREPLPVAPTRTKTLLHWIERARRKDAADLAVLLAGFATVREIGGPQQIAAALDELIERADDPRLGSSVVTWMREHMETVGYPTKVWTRLERLLVASGDPKSLAPARKLMELELGDRDTQDRFRERLPKVFQRLEGRLKKAKAIALTASERARCSPLSAAIDGAVLDAQADASPPPAAARPDELLAAVYASLEDDGLRMVLADALLDAGDPRGELISLQLSRLGKEPTKKSLARERALVRAHGLEWAGGLARHAKKHSLRFERGFLVALELKAIKAARLAVERDHPEWATLERVEFGADTKAWGSFVSPDMRSMRSIINLDARTAIALCKHHFDLALEEVGVVTEVGPRDALAKLAAAHAASSGLRKLRTLHISGSGLDRAQLPDLWASPLGQQIDTLVVTRVMWPKEWLATDWPVRRVVVGQPGTAWWMLEREDDHHRLWARLQHVDHDAKTALEGLKRRTLSSAVFEIEGPAGDRLASAREAIEECMQSLASVPPEVNAVSASKPLPWGYHPNGTGP